MGHSQGRDNVKTRKARRKKTERLALAKSKQKPATKESNWAEGRNQPPSRSRGSMVVSEIPPSLNYGAAGTGLLLKKRLCDNSTG
jgi:hypothetical protein